MDDSGFPRTPNRLLMLSGSRAQQSEVVETMIGACGRYNLGGSATICVLRCSRKMMVALKHIRNYIGSG
jgi:hypothetical protein